MFAMIDGLWWLDIVCALVLGIWVGRRWAQVVMQAKCAARTCDTICDMRVELMRVAADKMAVEKAYDHIRQANVEYLQKIHSLKTSNGIMGREITALTYQLPKPQRKMVQ